MTKTKTAARLVKASEVKSVPAVPVVPTLSRNDQFVSDGIAWFRSYIAVSEAYALVAFLWALHTWIYERFTSTPYLQISATTKGAGKTLCMDCIGLLSRSYHGFATIRTMPIVRLIEQYEGQITFGIDEAERLASTALGDTRSMLTTGYRKGKNHPVTIGSKVIEFRTWAPKMFALIGDMVSVLRDRSIQFDLERAEPQRDFHANEDLATLDAMQLIERWKHDIQPRMSETVIVTPEHLSGRDREIWTPLFSLAVMLDLSPRYREMLVAASVDMSAAKRLPPRANHSAVAEKDASDRIASDRLLSDLITVIGDKPFITSADSIVGLKQISTAPWRSWRKPTGLDQIALAALMRVHGLKAEQKKLSGTNTVLRGYSRETLLAAAAKIGAR